MMKWTDILKDSGKQTALAYQTMYTVYSLRRLDWNQSVNIKLRAAQSACGKYMNASSSSKPTSNTLAGNFSHLDSGTKSDLHL